MSAEHAEGKRGAEMGEAKVNRVVRRLADAGRH
jgi:hypothetical protein